MACRAGFALGLVWGCLGLLALVGLGRPREFAEAVADLPPALFALTGWLVTGLPALGLGTAGLLTRGGRPEARDDRAFAALAVGSGLAGAGFLLILYLGRWL